MSRIKTVSQLKVTLLDITPCIWRCIQVPASYSFWDLHVAIQDAMGWNDSHLHHFEVSRKSTHRPVYFGVPFNDDAIDAYHRPEPGWKHCVADYITLDRPTCDYVYDFGDNWRHRVELEGIMRTQPGVRYPICIDGARACPPDDCGGPPGYENLLEILSNAAHPEFEEMNRWLKSLKGIKGKFDPEDFDPTAVFFDDPSKRLLIASGGQLH